MRRPRPCAASWMGWAMRSTRAWPHRSLRELVSFAGGYGFPDRFQGRQDGELPFFKVSDMSTAGNERTLRRANHYVTRDRAARQSWHPMPTDSVVFAKVGAALLLNRRRMLSQESLIDNNMLAAIVGADLYPTWLYWWLQTIDFGVFVQPGAVPSVNQAQLGSLRVALPSRPEQQHIAEILDTLDAAIRKTEQLIAKLKQVKQGLLRDLLTRGVDDNGELRDSERHPEQFKDSRLGTLPMTWNVKPLDDLVDPARPIAYGILMPGTGYPGGVPVIKVKDIVGGRVKLDDLLLTSPAIDNEYRRSRVKIGDLLFTIRGTVGRMAAVPPQLENANITQDTARIAVMGANVSFIRQYLGMPEPQRFIGVHTLGVAVQGINLRDVRRIPIATPPRAEADEIARRLDCADARDTVEQHEVAKLRLLKQGLMEDLLTGRVRVTNLLGEAPA
jgi:type I restriction enzyme S subunit